jgi:GT2 family glycosyltransferase
MSEPLVTVVIPTLRGRRWLPDCIAALRQQTFRDFEIIVVDNASEDGTAEWLTHQPDLRVIRNAQNVGFAAACNQGIQASKSPLIAVLNDDTQPEPRWLESLVNAMRAGDGRRIGACASLLLFAERPSVVQSAGIAVDRAAIAWDRLRGYPADAAVVQRAGEVFGASAGAALYRRAMLDEVGLFDERFFAYLEDVDLAWRAQRAGWRCLYVPAARALHRTSATSGEGSAMKYRLLGRNKVWLVAKNARWLDLPLVMLLDSVITIYAGLQRRNWHHLAGRWEGIRQIMVTFKQRQGRYPPLIFDPFIALWHPVS